MPHGTARFRAAGSAFLTNLNAEALRACASDGRTAARTDAAADFIKPEASARMPGKCPFVAFFLLVALMSASAMPRAADMTPAWFPLVSGHLGAGGFEFFGSQPEPDRAEAAAPPTASRISDEDLCDALVSSARASGLPVTFFTKLIWQESRFVSSTVSRSGAVGIAQFMPTMAKEVGLEDPLDPRQALPAAAQLLRALVDKFGNVGLAAAAYNAGPARVRAWMERRGTLPAETRRYVAAITGRAADAWRGVKSAAMAFAMPSGMPCNSVPTFAAATRSEQAQAAARIPPSARSGSASHALNLRRRHARTRTAGFRPRDRAHGRG